MSKEITGFDSWIKAGGILFALISIRSAYYALRGEGKSQYSEQLHLLRRIDSKLSRIVPEETAGFNYDDL